MPEAHTEFHRSMFGIVGFIPTANKYVGWSFNSGTDFFPGIIIRSEMATAWDTWQLCTSVCAKPEVGISPHCSVEALGWTFTTVCVAFHDGGESTAACVHWFLFPSGENWCWNVLNAASSFRRVLPKSIEDIWVVFPFQKWTPILRRRPPAQAGLPPPTPRTLWHVCEKSFVLTDVWLSERLQKKSE